MWLAVFYPVYPEMISTWLTHSDNSHGLLVPFISVYLIWSRRSSLLSATKQTSKSGLIVLIGSLLLFLLSYAGGTAFIARTMIVFSLTGLVLYNYGFDIYKKIAFALLFLFFMVPIPDSIISLVSLPLKQFATDISAVLIRLSSIPVYQEGNMLYFAETQLEVAEACSGLRSIVSFIMLGTLFIYFSKLSMIRKSIFLISTIPLAMFANIVRVTGTGILAHFYGSVVARGFLHEFSGIVVFVFGLFLLFLEYKLIKHYQKDVN
jgi:exosortase